MKKLKKFDNGMHYFEVEDEIVQSFLEKKLKTSLSKHRNVFFSLRIYADERRRILYCGWFENV
jgi:hypothetical protein